MIRARLPFARPPSTAETIFGSIFFPPIETRKCREIGENNRGKIVSKEEIGLVSIERDPRLIKKSRREIEILT